MWQCNKVLYTVLKWMMYSAPLQWHVSLWKFLCNLFVPILLLLYLYSIYFFISHSLVKNAWCIIYAFGAMWCPYVTKLFVPTWSTMVVNIYKKKKYMTPMKLEWVITVLLWNHYELSSHTMKMMLLLTREYHSQLYKSVSCSKIVVIMKMMFSILITIVKCIILFLIVSNSNKVSFINFFVRQSQIVVGKPTHCATSSLKTPIDFHFPTPLLPLN